MPTTNLTQRRLIYKQFKKAMELPDPMRSFEEYQKLNNEDLDEMNRLELRNEWNRVELALMLMSDDQLLYVEPDGGHVTAKAYLLTRLAAIKRRWKGVA